MSLSAAMAAALNQGGSMKKTLCSLLVLSVMAAAVPVHAAGPEATKPTADPKPIAAAISKAGADLSTHQTSTVQPQVKAQKVPTSLPRSGSDRIRKQGKTGMIIGLVSSVVGVAATVYMVKEMQKDNDQD
jgi:hypothetical protein